MQETPKDELKKYKPLGIGIIPLMTIIFVLTLIVIGIHEYIYG